MKNNENLKLCNKCKGECCKSYAGAVFPQDIKEPISIEVLTQMYKRGYQFDYWEGDVTVKAEGLRAWFIRPQHTNSKEKVVDASWGGQCVFLGDKGCSMSFDDRPSMCKALMPIAPGGSSCYNVEKGYTKKDAAIAWLSYNEIIEEAIKTLREMKEFIVKVSQSLASSDGKKHILVYNKDRSIMDQLEGSNIIKLYLNKLGDRPKAYFNARLIEGLDIELLEEVETQNW